ncbi:MAG: AMP-binding protein [Betaproteobacteria bacterium]|nr:AMP-binding protein [Betaproteobacteria bacterium]
MLGMVRDLSVELRVGASDIDRLGLDHQLERDFGMDSLARVELLARIQREFNVQLTEEVFATAETPRDLVVQVKTAGGINLPSVAMAEAIPEDRLEVPPQDIQTLTGLLNWHAAHHGERTHVTLYSDGEQVHNISYRALQQDAQKIAAGLLALGLEAGSRVAIMLPTCREFLAVFYGAIYAGCVPVPLYPPARLSQLEDHMRRIAGIVANAGAAVLITDSRAKIPGYLLRAQCETLHNVVTAEELAAHGAAPALPEVRPDDIAFLQYTSGSTGNPKGVILTHNNLLANLRSMKNASGVAASDTFVSWLPLYHDMGLIGACMGSLYVGFHLVLLSPLAFLSRPARWLWAIHRHRATISAAPNFAYEICAGKIDERDLEGIDLSCWRIAYNGAEPVSPVTLDRFSARFAPHGFRREALTPVYGLAENSVGLAFPPHGREPLVDHIDRNAMLKEGVALLVDSKNSHAQHIVSCGQALPGHEIRIVDASSTPLPERHVGRVQFRGPSATSGYYGNMEATARLFDGPWLNSGDLGYLASGELYLTGREKDIVIRGGHNIYPQELEEAIGRLDGIRKGGVAIFPATDPRSGTERLIILAETRTEEAVQHQRLQTEINNLAVDLIGMPADDIVLALPRSVLKTSSGKVRRAACRDLYERGAIVSSQRLPWLQVLRLGRAGAVAKSVQTLRLLANLGWAGWAWAIYLLVVPLAWVLIALAPTLHLRRTFARQCARLALALTGLTPRVEGLQHLAGSTPCILAVNHASYLDALVLTAVLPQRFAYVAKQELLSKPVASIPLRRLGSAFVERFDSVRGAEDTRELERLARDGVSLVFFVEGTFRRNPGLLPFRMGAFSIATQCRTPIIPVAIKGTRLLLPGNTKFPHHARLEVAIGLPLMAQGEDWQAALQLRNATRQWILEHSGEPDDE